MSSRKIICSSWCNQEIIIILKHYSALLTYIKICDKKVHIYNFFAIADVKISVGVT